MREKSKEINASDVEHVGVLVTGGLLLLGGLSRGGAIGSLMKLGGLALLFRGQSGYRKLYDAIGLPLPQTPTGVGGTNVKVESSIEIERPASELYRVWRNLENLPVFMDHLLSVHEVDDRRSIWVAKAPVGTVIKWDAEIVNDVEDQLIAWQTLEGSGVDNAGTVRFEDMGNGRTQLRVVLRYSPPGDMLGVWIGKIFRNDPQTQIDNDLRRFKQIMEIGGRDARVPASAPQVEMR